MCEFFRAIKLPKEKNFSRFTFRPSPGNRSLPKEGIYGNPHSSRHSAFSHIREALTRLLSASVESLMSSA